MVWFTFGGCGWYCGWVLRWLGCVGVWIRLCDLVIDGGLVLISLFSYVWWFGVIIAYW